MPTRFEDTLTDMGLGGPGPCQPSSRQYVRELKASHEALLKAAKEVRAMLRAEPSMQGNKFDQIGIDFNEAIRNAEEMNR